VVPSDHLTSAGYEYEGGCAVPPPIVWFPSSPFAFLLIAFLDLSRQTIIVVVSFLLWISPYPLAVHPPPLFPFPFFSPTNPLCVRVSDFFPRGFSFANPMSLFGLEQVPCTFSVRLDPRRLVLVSCASYVALYYY
jgi:hypothetical protein